MDTAVLDRETLLPAIGETVIEMKEILSNIPEEKVNSIPYAGSWSAAQLARHVSKSVTAIARALRSEAMPAQRPPAERVPELKKIFLDFNHKMKSPDFIVPETGPYEKQASVDDLDKSYHRLKENAAHAGLNELVENLPMGPVTKLEMLHFVLYHNQRHLHQLKKINAALM